ncbi:MAG TPA: alpha-amylase family glycosyl hydrolase, partial [Spirochaetales bacterium]|nr:alpha-amylase family glycosyl hydrolase [Spirochaetales bacterium]
MDRQVHAFSMDFSAFPQHAPDGLARIECHKPRFEFHVSALVRKQCGLDSALSSTTGTVVFADFYSARVFAARLNERINPALHPEKVVHAGAINAMALIDELLHGVCDAYRQSLVPGAFDQALAAAQKTLGTRKLDAVLLAFVNAFPPADVYAGTLDAKSWLASSTASYSHRAMALEELLMLRLANTNPAFEPYAFLFDDTELCASQAVDTVMAALDAAFAALPVFGPDQQSLPDMLKAPAAASPYSLAGQLEFMRSRWGMVLGSRMQKLLGGMDMLAEENRPRFFGPGPAKVLSYDHSASEYERFSQDKDWMPRVVMMAKSVLVWLDQLGKRYGRDIRTLDAIPDQELDVLASRGFNALWLIGLWERSNASRRIKELCGNPDAAASAYSLYDYEIAQELGGWPALENLRQRALWRGIRLAADMVPNHTGIDSAWVRDRPDLFITTDHPPFPGYSFTGENLSGDNRVGIWLEDHYYSKQDAAVVFKRTDFANGKTTYLYHGNDGTSMPWNDTAQIDFLKPEARQAVRERILHVAANFPIIRFDAAMIMAKKHFRRLWYPEPGQGGDIASRGEHAMEQHDFDQHMPAEFWREVVDECAQKAPDTLLLAEAFWMMEGYFVRTLGMHRVYNSAFMNMLKTKDNQKYRQTIKNTQEFDKDILKRFVNFMNNPDEETALAQFGKDDHYFGVCSLMATLPGLPMFGHGQIEGFSEKYGMEYRRAYRDESPDSVLVDRHEREIFPILKKRYLFAGVDHFLLYDLVRADGCVDENVFAYSNGQGSERALVLFNNAWERSAGSIHHSCSFAKKESDGSKHTVSMSLADGLGLSGKSRHYLVMREQRSDLWYVRASENVARYGLGVVLEGFQCQVFLDIAEIQDDSLGTYSTLHDRLGGSGVADLSAALQDIAHEELYAAWNRAFGPGYFSAITSLPTGSVAQEAQEKHDSASLAFASLASAYITDLSFGNSGESMQEAKAQAAGITASRVRFALFALYSALNADKGGKSQRDASALRANELWHSIQTIPLASYALFAFAAMLCLKDLAGSENTGVGAKLLAERWYLDRKLKEAMQVCGLPGDQAHQAVSIAKAAIARADDKQFAKGKRLSAALASLGSDEDLA